MAVLHIHRSNRYVLLLRRSIQIDTLWAAVNPHPIETACQNQFLIIWNYGDSDVGEHHESRQDHQCAALAVILLRNRKYAAAGHRRARQHQNG